MSDAVYLSAQELARRAAAPDTLFRAESGDAWANLVVKDRAAPVAEAHDHETDIYVVREGEALLHLGGTLVDEKVVEPGQRRGTRIEGGRVQRLAAGDMVFIPEGAPHMVDARTTRLVYVVVKIATR